MKKKKTVSSIYEELKNKHESDLTSEERRLLEKEKLASLSLAGKAEYLWTYYKWFLVVAVIIIFLAMTVKEAWRKGKEHSLLSVCVANAVGNDWEPAAVRFKEYIQNENERDTVSFLTSLIFPKETDRDEEGNLYLVPSSEMEMVSGAALMSNLNAKALDVFICPEIVYQVYEEQGLFLNLWELELPENGVLTESGKALVFSEIPELEELLGEAYGNAYVTIVTNSEHKEMAETYLRYLLSLG